MKQARFSTTHWSVVTAAGGGDSKNALALLLQAYWFPLYTFIRRSNHSIHDAQDLTQGFIAHLLERDIISTADPDKGRFRSFLLGALKNYMANARRHDGAQKRGGGIEPLSIDEEESENRFLQELSHDYSPSDQFEHSWAMELLARVTERLRSEFDDAGRTSLFDALQPRLAGADGGKTYKEIAGDLGLSESSVSVSLHRMRKRYGELVRLEIAETVADPEDVEPELQHLISIISTGN